MKEAEAYRENLESILGFTDGKHYLTQARAATYLGVTRQTAAKRFSITHDGISAETLAKRLAVLGE